MTNSTTDVVASSAYSTCARNSVHRLAMPGLGFRSVHGLLGIFRKNNEEVPRGDSLERFCLVFATFLKTSVRPCNLPKGMPRKAHPRTDGGSALGSPCQLQLEFTPAITSAIGQPPASPLGTATPKLVHRDAARLPLF